MDINFFPFTEPTFKGKIVLPNNDKTYSLKENTKKYYLKKDNYKDIFIDVNKLNTKKNDSYNISELKEFARLLDVNNFSKYSKPELVKIIKSKLKI